MSKSFCKYWAFGFGIVVSSVLLSQPAWAITPRTYCAKQLEGDFDECLARGGSTQFCEVVACAKLIKCRNELGLPPVVPGTFDDEVAYCLKEVFDEPYCGVSTTVEE